MISRLLKHDAFLLVILLAIVLIVALPILTYPLGRDQGEFATIGRGILNGRVPYTELWNPKPPAVFYIYALVMRLFGQTALALRAIDFFIVPLISATLFWIGRHISNRRIGLWAALLFPVFYFTETFWTLTQNDGIALLPMVLAVGCGVKVIGQQLSAVSHQRSAISGQLRTKANDQKPIANRQSPLLYSFLAGVLCGYVVWFKYPFALLGVLLAVWYAWVRWRMRHSTPLQRSDLYIALAFVIGGLLVLGGGAAYLMSVGAWSEFIRSAQVTAQYTALTFNATDFTNLMSSALNFRWQQWGFLVVLASIGAVAVINSYRQGKKNTDHVGTRYIPSAARNQIPTDEEPPTANRQPPTAHSIFLLLWLAAASIMMLAQAKGYDYHWLPMLPPLALLGAVGVEWVLEQVRSIVSALKIPSPVHGGGLGWGFTHFLSVSLWFNIFFPLCLCGLLIFIMVANIWPKAWLYLTGREDQAAYYDRFVAGAADEFKAGDSLRVANLLRERVTPGNSLYIWGFRPDVYFLSGLNPATRFIFQFPLLGSWYPPEWQQENVDTLWAALPPYVLVLEVDYMPWVTGRDEDSNTLLQEYTELNNWLIFNYERETQIGHFFVWRRKS